EGVGRTRGPGPGRELLADAGRRHGRPGGTARAGILVQGLRPAGQPPGPGNDPPLVHPRTPPGVANVPSTRRTPPGGGNGPGLGDREDSPDPVLADLRLSGRDPGRAELARGRSTAEVHRTVGRGRAAENRTGSGKAATDGRTQRDDGSVEAGGDRVPEPPPA